MTEKPAPEDIAAVVWFLPFFERAGAGFGAWEKTKDGRIRLSYCQDAIDFIRVLEERGWVETGCRPGATTAALRHWQNPELVAGADSATLRGLLSDIIRTERLCPGHLLEAHVRGYLTAILKRLKTLRSGAAGDRPKQEDRTG